MSSLLVYKNPQITNLYISNFRNIKQAKINFHHNFNLIIGNNAEGKTNLLESLSVICSLKPLNSLASNDLIKVGEEKAHIQGDFINTLCNKVAIDIYPQGKKAFINEKAIKNSLALSSNFSLVSFVPSELNMISGSASLRRKALDQACISIMNEHGIYLRNYEKLLLQRNALLKSYPIEHTLLQTFTLMLIEEAVKIVLNRIKIINIIQPFFAQKIIDIFGTNNYLIKYFFEEKNYADLDASKIKNILLNSYEYRKKQEIIRKVTLFGPHLDDMLFFINDLSAQKSCSRGQSRALVLAFKLAQMLMISNTKQAIPLVILDDIVAELDNDKKANLLEVISSLKAQAFFSATESDYFAKYKDIQILKIKNGAIL